MISFLFSFRLFCFILFLQSTFFLFVNLSIYFATKTILQCGEKLSRVGKIITDLYLSYPGQANFSNISSQNEAGFLHERQKVGLDRMVIRLALSTGSPSWKYEHRRASALLRNIQNIRICMGKKPIVSVTYENERISIKNSLPYLKCVLRLSCVVHGPIYGLLWVFM